MTLKVTIQPIKLMRSQSTSIRTLPTIIGNYIQWANGIEAYCYVTITLRKMLLVISEDKKAMPIERFKEVESKENKFKRIFNQ